MFKCLNVQMFKCSNVPIFKCAMGQTHVQKDLCCRFCIILKAFWQRKINISFIYCHKLRVKLSQCLGPKCMMEIKCPGPDCPRTLWMSLNAYMGRAGRRRGRRPRHFCRISKTRPGLHGTHFFPPCTQPLIQQAERATPSPKSCPYRP